MMFRARSVLLSAITAGVVALGSTFAVSGVASAAPLDPGTCGVRVSGPDSAGVTFTYQMRNGCSTGYNFSIYLPASGRYATGSSSGTTCQYNAGFDTQTSYYSATADPNWQIQVC